MSTAPAVTPRQPRRWSFAVARVDGISIRLHVTFVALLVLVAVGAASAGEDVAGAVGWLVLLFGCVVVHELAHSIVARSKGIVVEEIDLLPIGGLSRLSRIPDQWREEALIAVAGPIASIAVMAVAFGVAAIGGVALWPASLVEGPLLARLGWANLMLAGFNALPIFPLDGGRVLRALLERSHSRAEATRRAARLGRVFAFGLIALGLAGNIGLFLIGFFVVIAGRAEEAAAIWHDVLAPLPVEAAARPATETDDAEAFESAPRLRCGTSLEEALPLLATGPVAVVDDADRLVGYVTVDTVEACLRNRLVRVDP